MARQTQLAIDGLHVYAFTDTHVKWFPAAKSWDCISLHKDGQRTEWHWCKDKPGHAVKFDVFGPGDYEFRYRTDAGYLSSGVVIATLPVKVKSPVSEFLMPRQATAGGPLDLDWTLLAAVSKKYNVLLQVPGAPDVTIQSLLMLPHTDATTLTGQAHFLAPPIAGEFKVVVRGNGSSDSTLLTRTTQVSVSEECRRQTFIQVVTSAGSKRAVIVSPGSRLTIEWCAPLPSKYAICIVESDAVPRVLMNATAHTVGSQRAGSCMLRPFDKAGSYSVCLCAVFREGHVLLPVTYCHVFVSVLADVPASAVSETAASTIEPDVLVPNEALAAKPQCVICMSADVNAMVEPCGHAQFCRECLTQHLSAQRNCPVCRDSATGNRVIFLP